MKRLRLLLHTTCMNLNKELNRKKYVLYKFIHTVLKWVKLTYKGKNHTSGCLGKESRGVWQHRGTYWDDENVLCLTWIGGTHLTAHTLFKTLLTILKMCTYKVLHNKVDIKNKVKFLNEKMIGKIIYIHMSRTVIQERKGMPEGCSQLIYCIRKTSWEFMLLVDAVLNWTFDDLSTWVSSLQK